jgi:hypothetical protein
MPTSFCFTFPSFSALSLFFRPPALDLLLQQKVMGLATLGRQFKAGVASITFGLEISGEAVEMGPSRPRRKSTKVRFSLNQDSSIKLLLKKTEAR